MTYPKELRNKEKSKLCHAVDVGDEEVIPKYCEGKQNIHPSLGPCCCQHCCTCGG